MDKLTQVLAEVFNILPESIKDSDGPETIEEWDSLKHLILVSALEKAFGVKMTTDDVFKMDTVAKIKNILERHGVNCRNK